MRYHRQALFRNGVSNSDHLLLWDKEGRLPRASSINTAYHQVQKKIGMEPKLGTHTLRHRLASLMVGSKDISLSCVSKYLGHASVLITQKYYIGLLPEQVEVGAGKVAKVIAE